MNKEQIEMETIDETKEDNYFDARPSTVFYEQWYKTINTLPPKERDKAYKYIFEYAFYGIEPDKPKEDKTPSMSYVIFCMAKPNVDAAQQRYDVSKENGQKGGRPKKVTEEIREKILELRKNGMTQKQVATELSLSIKTIQRVEKDKSQNHNVNVNDNVNDNVNVKTVASNEDNTEMASPKMNHSDSASNKKMFAKLSNREKELMRNNYERFFDISRAASDFDVTEEVVAMVLTEHQKAQQNKVEEFLPFN